MLNLILIDKKPLENPESQPYFRMAFDGMFFYCCMAKKSKIYKLNCEGVLVSCIDTECAYALICYDCKETCFWAIASERRNIIYKLNDCLCQIGSIWLPRISTLYRDISYSPLNDMLLLSGGNMVVKVSKSGVARLCYCGQRGIRFVSAVQMFEKMFINCNFQNNGPGIMGILYPNSCFDYITCMPRGYSLNSMCMVNGRGNNDYLFILATQNYKTSYLMKYQVKNCEDEIRCNPTPTEKDLDDSGMVSVYVDSTDVRADILI